MLARYKFYEETTSVVSTSEVIELGVNVSTMPSISASTLVDKIRYLISSKPTEMLFPGGPSLKSASSPDRLLEYPIEPDFLLAEGRL